MSTASNENDVDESAPQKKLSFEISASLEISADMDPVESLTFRDVSPVANHLSMLQDAAIQGAVRQGSEP